MSRRIFYGTTTAVLSEIVHNGLFTDCLVSSKRQAEKLAERVAAEKGGKPVLLKILYDQEMYDSGFIKPERILVCKY